MIELPKTYLIKALVQPQSMLSLITKTTKGANVLSISPFLVIDGNTQNETSKLDNKLTELKWKLWQTCNTQAPPTCVQVFRNYGFGLPQAHKRDKQDVLHVSWLYASEQKKECEWNCICVHGDFLQTSIYKQVTIMHTCKMHILTLRFLSIVPKETNLRKQG